MKPQWISRLGRLIGGLLRHWNLDCIFDAQELPGIGTLKSWTFDNFWTFKTPWSFGIIETLGLLGSDPFEPRQLSFEEMGLLDIWSRGPSWPQTFESLNSETFEGVEWRKCATSIHFSVYCAFPAKSIIHNSS